MKLKWILFAVALCVATCFAKPDAGAYAKPDFDTYQPILDRMPFGAVPDTSAVNQGPVVDPNEQRKKEMLARQVNMSAVNIMPDGRTAIGFTDLSAKPPVNHYLHVGESSDGWTVVDADYDEETATIKKDGVEIALQLGKGLIEPAVPGGPGGPRPPALLAANQAVNAAALVNVNAPPTAPVFGGGVQGGPPGLRREPRPAPVAPNAATGRTTAFPSAAAQAQPGSYRERLEQREAVQQIEKEKAEQEQKETLKRLAAAAAQEEMRKQQQEAAEAAEEQGAIDLDE